MQRISIKEGSTLNITDSNNATPCDNDIKDRKASVIDSDNTKPQAGLPPLPLHPKLLHEISYFAEFPAC